MTEYDKFMLLMRNELAAKFREGANGYRPEPSYDKDGKWMGHPLYGKKHMESTKKLMAEAKKGNTNKAGTKVKDTSNMQKPGAHDGKKNPNYKGGIAGKPGSTKRKAYMKTYNKKYQLNRKKA